MKLTKKYFIAVFAFLACSGCGKSAYYPQPAAACVEAQKVREQMKTVSGDDRALMEAKAKGLEEACRDGMRQKTEQQRHQRYSPPLQ